MFSENVSGKGSWENFSSEHDKFPWLFSKTKHDMHKQKKFKKKTILKYN